MEESKILKKIDEAKSSFLKRQKLLNKTNKVLQGKPYTINKSNNDYSYQQYTVVNVLNSAALSAYASWSDSSYRAVLKPLQIADVQFVKLIESFLNDNLEKANFNYMMKKAKKAAIIEGNCPINIYYDNGKLCLEEMDILR